MQELYAIYCQPVPNNALYTKIIYLFILKIKNLLLQFFFNPFYVFR